MTKLELQYADDNALVDLQAAVNAFHYVYDALGLPLGRHKFFSNHHLITHTS